jgi:hypothetical protein
MKPSRRRFFISIKILFMNDDLEEEEKFSDDPEEQLKIENDILKLKLQAELGADFTVEEELSPDVENIFLKNVLELEHQFANASYKSIFEILGSPEVAKEDELDDEEIKPALARVEELLDENGIVVDYGEEYDPRTKYQFITEELFFKESTLVNIPGMTTHFIYEEFHPNHKLDIKGQAEAFFTHWELRSFDEKNSIELASSFKLEEGRVVTKAQVVQQFSWIFDSYVRIENFSASIDQISFSLGDDDTGEGTVGGTVSYVAILENEDTKSFEGPFSLHLDYNGYWSIDYFQWPGFNW